jgi:hypothetical protein
MSAGAKRPPASAQPTDTNRRTSSVRVAAIVVAPADTVRAAAAKLPTGVTSYVVETGAGVLVTLERPRRWPRHSRRRVIRGLQRELAALRDRAE